MFCNVRKDRLKSEDLQIDCLNDIPNTPFLGVLDKALSYEFISERMNVDVSYLSKNKKFYRAAIISPNERRCCYENNRNDFSITRKY